MKTKRFSDIQSGDRIKIWVDSDFLGRPIYTELVASSDAIYLSNEKVNSGYGIYYGEKGLMFISDGDKQVEILEE